MNVFAAFVGLVCWPYNRQQA